MKHNYKFLLVLTLMFLNMSLSKGQFSGAYAPNNWGTGAINSDGTTNTAGAPGSISMTSGDNGSGFSGTNDFTITVPQTGFISFNWSYSTNDDPFYDYPLVLVNGVATILNGYNLFGNFSQSGSEPCIAVTAGQVFGFRMYTDDNGYGPGTCVFSNFQFSTGALTISPPSASVCPGGTLALTASGASSYTWSGGISNGVPFTPTASTIYTVTSGSGQCISQQTVSVTYNPPLSITGPTTNICANASATLTGSGGTTYTWSTGAISPSIVISPSVTTSYTLSGVSAQGCNTNGVKTVTVDAGLPVVTASASAPGNSVCPGQTVTLNGSGALTYTWTGGSVTVTNGVAFSPVSTTNYTLSAANACGSGTTALTLVVLPAPVVNASASSTSLCAGSSLTLSGTGNALTYTWSGSSATITDGTGFVPAATATYTVIGSSAQSCTASATIPVTVHPVPSLAPTTSHPLLCQGQSATLTASGASSYTWTSASQTVNTSSFVVTPSLAGTSVYTVTKANSLCQDTKTISIITNALPTVAAIVMPSTVCALSPATLAAGGAQTYTWTAPGTPNYTFTGASNVIMTPVPATYTVAASDGTCINTGTVHLATNPNPTITISVSSPTLCDGESVTIGASGASNYTWTATSGTFYTSSIVESPSVSTIYQVTGDNSFGCESQGSQVILVYNSPTMVVTPDKNLVCSGGAVSLSVTGASTYTWDAAANYSSGNTVVVNPVSLVSGMVIYTVSGTNTVGCMGTQTTQVNVFVPVLSVSGNTNACAGGTIQLTATGGNSGSYIWNTGYGSPVSGAVLNSTIAAPSVFTVSANSTSLALTCPASSTVDAGIFPNPVVQAAAQRTTICVNESVELYASGADSYQWNNGSGSSTITVQPLIQTSYTVTGTDANGCKSTGTVQVRVSACVGLNEIAGAEALISVYPNPNNGEFTVKTTGDIRLILVNELGQLIQDMELTGANAHQVSVRDLAKGVYFITGTTEHTRIYQKVIVTR